MIPEFVQGPIEELCPYFVDGGTSECVYMTRADWFTLIHLMMVQQQELKVSCLSQGQSKEDCKIE